jgi:electron transfer flavoprotein beta subunit
VNIIVCIKQVPDPEGPPGSFVINPALNRVEAKGIPPVLSLFDENALEAALRIKDALGHDKVKITVVSMGKRISGAVLQTALAAGADELVKIEDGALESAVLDSHATATTLASAIRNTGKYGLILTGRQAADWNAGQVGIGIARFLGIPAVTLAGKVTVKDGCAVVERVTPRGHEVVRTPLPSLIAVSNEAGALRYPTMMQRREAKHKPVISWSTADIGLHGNPETKLIVKGFFVREMRKGRCEIISGDTPATAGLNLAQRLMHDGVLSL